MITTGAAQLPMPAWSGTRADAQFNDQEHGAFDCLDPYVSSQQFNTAMHMGTQFDSQQSMEADLSNQYIPFTSPNLSLAAMGAGAITDFPVMSPYTTSDNASVAGKTYAASFGDVHLNTNTLYNSPSLDYNVTTTRAASAQPMLGTSLLPLATDNLAHIKHSPSLRDSHSLNVTPARQRLHSHPTDRYNPPQLSPTVTIEECEGPVLLSRLGRSHSRRSHTSSQSRTHLSPFDPVERFDADDEGTAPHPSSPIISHQGDYDDQSTFDAQEVRLGGGLDPSMRRTLGDQEISSLEDQTTARRFSEKNQDVEDWLSTSDIGSDVEGSRPRRKQSTTVRRSQAPARRPRPQNQSLPGSTPSYPSMYHTVGNAHSLHADGDALTATVQDGADTHIDPGSPAADISAMSLHNHLEDDSMASSCNSRPWVDLEPVLKLDNPNDHRCQPSTANMAMARFIRRAKETDNASLAATLASSRRKSESDIGSLFNAPFTSEPILPGQVPLTRAALQKRGHGLFAGLRDNILPGATSKLKRKISNKTQQRGLAQTPVNASTPLLDPESTLVQTNQARNSSLTLNTSVDALSSETRSPSKVGVMQTVRQSLTRNRSSSNLARSPRTTPGLAAMWQQTGGPPVARLGATPFNSATIASTRGPRTEIDDSGDEIGQDEETPATDLSVRLDVYLHPSTDGFRYHAGELNPHIQPYLLARIVDEQMKRFERLTGMANDHVQRAACGACPSKELCRSLGGQYKFLEPKHLGSHGENMSAIFHVTQAGQKLDSSGEGQSIPAQFPVGIPLPPVPRLPARFECPLCFQVKDFYKPSDWTKHVHEDVQPFTCTFTACNEIKSFKRKADWVRHESERHRQLESWTCTMSPDCQHTCHRKDNFVQHLVREHKVPEPKVRTGRAVTARSPQRTDGTLMMNATEVWALVDSCKSEAAKDARMEPCRFCGSVFANYKKLTVHLAKHLEQISLPIISQLEYGMTSTAFPNRGQPMLTTAQNMAATPGITASPVTVMGGFASDPFGVYSGNTTTAATYPPTFAAVQEPMQFSQGLAPSSPYYGASPNIRQPSFSMPGRQRAVSFNGQASPGMLQQGSTYPPVSLPTQTAFAPTMQQDYSIPWQQAVPQGFYQGASPGGTPFLSPRGPGNTGGPFGQHQSPNP